MSLDLSLYFGVLIVSFHFSLGHTKYGLIVLCLTRLEIENFRNQKSLDMYFYHRISVLIHEILYICRIPTKWLGNAMLQMMAMLIKITKTHVEIAQIYFSCCSHLKIEFYLYIVVNFLIFINKKTILNTEDF